MDAMLNVLNSAPKITKKRKPKSETIKKNHDSPPSTTPLSPSHSSLKSVVDLPSPPRSPVHSPSTLDLDSLTIPQPVSNPDESLSFSEPTLSSDYVPLSTENAKEDDVTPDPEPVINIEPIIEKPPQLKVLKQQACYLFY